MGATAAVNLASSDGVDQRGLGREPPTQLRGWAARFPARLDLIGDGAELRAAVPASEEKMRERASVLIGSAAEGVDGGKRQDEVGRHRRKVGR